MAIGISFKATAGIVITGSWFPIKKREGEVFSSCRTWSGIQKSYITDKTLDSGFRRNDDHKYIILTISISYENFEL